MKFGFMSVAAVSGLLLAALLLLLNTGGDKSLSGEPLEFFCAAGMQPAVQPIIDDYQEEFGVEILPTYAGSGRLFGQLKVSDVDLYLAADVTYLENGRKENLVREIMPIAYQHPVIAVQKGNPKNIRGLEDISRDDVRFSLADQGAAVSKVSKRLLDPSGKWEAIAAAADVERSTVNFVANDIKMGDFDAGIVWDATAGQYPELEIITVPELEGSPNQITIGVLESSNTPTRALHFARYLTARDKGLKHFEKLGYELVKGDKWDEHPEIHVFTGGLNFPAIDDTIKAFGKREGVTVLTTPNGCGILVGQMKMGARPDLYFSCDITFMDQVGHLFMDPINVSKTDMVIVVEKGNPQNITALADLAKKGIGVALCDPDKSALGKLSADLLEKHGLLERVRANQKYSSSTAPELFEAVAVGRLDAAIVYRANTSAGQSRIDVISIDDPDASAIQPIATGKESDHPHLTGRLTEAILSAKSKETFGKLGFEWLVE